MQQPTTSEDTTYVPTAYLKALEVNSQRLDRVLTKLISKAAYYNQMQDNIRRNYDQNLPVKTYNEYFDELKKEIEEELHGE